MDSPATYAPVSIAIALCLLIGDTRGVQWTRGTQTPANARSRVEKKARTEAPVTTGTVPD
jgi:hypothetical protein